MVGRQGARYNRAVGSTGRAEGTGMRYWRHILFVVMLAGFAPVARSQAPVSYRVPVTGHVRDAATGAPIRGARLTLGGLELLSGSNGRFPSADVPISTAMEEADVVVTADGYLPWSFAGVALRDGQPIVFRVGLRSPLPGEPLLPSGPEAPAPSAPSAAGGTGIGVVAEPPEWILIGVTGSSACMYDTELFRRIPVMKVRFVDYVRGVLPNEWIVFWPAASLQAGAVAVKQYAWYNAWVRQKWRRQGYPFDLLDSTCDQVYKPGSSHVRTDAAITATWRQVLTRNGALFETGYRARDEQCPTNGNCMGQWGSKYRADAGATSAEILTAYYANARIEEWGEPPCSTSVASTPGPAITPAPRLGGRSRIYLPAVVHCGP